MDVVFVTKNGMVKRTSVEEFRAQGRGGGGVTAMGVGAGDAIVDAVVLGAAKGVMVVTAGGTAIHFAAEELRAMGRGAQGVRAIRLKENDTVVAVVAA
jgi:DNA gyrase subunit A